MNMKSVSFTEPGELSYQLRTESLGQCPSRLCGMGQVDVAEGSSQSPLTTATVKNYQNRQLMLQLESVAGVEMLMLVNHSVPKQTGLPIVPLSLQTLFVQGKVLTGQSAWTCKAD